MFKNQTTAHEVLNRHRKAHGIGKGLDLDVKTRFGTVYIMLSSVVVNSLALDSAVKDSAFTSTAENNSAAKKAVLDASFWEEIKFLTSMLEMPFACLTKLESNSCNIADAYWMMADLKQWFEQASSRVPLKYAMSFKQVKKALLERISYGWNEAMPVAALLDPRFRGRVLEMEQLERAKALEYVEKLAGIGSSMGAGKAAEQPAQ